MRLICSLLIAVTFFSSCVSAKELSFFEKETDRFWSVFGGAETDTGQATCYGRATKKDGSFIQLHRSLVNGELWAFIHDTEWEISGQDHGTLRWNFYAEGKRIPIDGADFDYIVKDKNTIVVLQIKPDRFLEVMWSARYFTMVMPANISNFSASFESKGSTMLAALAECIKQNRPEYKDFKPSIEKSPDAIKEQL